MAEKISEKSVPVQELEPATEVSSRPFLRSVVIASLASFCVFVGVLVYHIYVPLETEPTPQKKVALSKSDKPSQPISVTDPESEKSSIVFRGVRKQPYRAEPVQPKEIKPLIEKPQGTPKKETSPKQTEEQSVMVSMPEKQLSVPVAQTDTVIKTEKKEKAQTTSSKSVLSLEDALRLRDALASGKTCQGEFRLIMKSSLPDEKLRENLVEHLMPICAATSVLDELKDLFMQDKKDALMTYYRLTSSNRWIAYIKAVGTMVVDVRRLNPVKQKPKDMISMAQNALMAHDVAGAVTHLDRLPPEIKADFSDFLGLAGSYRLAQRDTEKLILSFAKKEEK